MMTFYSILGVSSHLFLYLRQEGFEAAKAAQSIGLLFTMGLVGKFAFGFLADHLRPNLVFQLNLAVMLVGSLFLASGGGENLYYFLAFFGLGWGGLYTMLQVLTVEQFGLRAAGKILGTITVLDAIGGGLGPWITGVLFDKYGNYDIAFSVVAVLVGVSFVSSIAFLRSKPREAILQESTAT